MKPRPLYLVRLDPESLEFSVTEYANQAQRWAQLQAAVGGYVELVRIAGGIDCYCDEDGISKRLPVTCSVHPAGVPKGLPPLWLRGALAFVVPRAESPEHALARVRLAAVPLRPCQHADRAQPAATR